LRVFNAQKGVVKEYTVAPPSTSDQGLGMRYPFLIRAVRSVYEQQQLVGCQFVISRTPKTPVDGKLEISYQFSAVDLSFDSDETEVLALAWRVQGSEYGTHVRWVADQEGHGRWIVGGMDEIKTLAATKAEDGVSATPSDHLEQPQETLPVLGITEPEAYPYSWTQTHESVTGTFDLAFTPGTAFHPNQDIIIRITSEAMTLRLPPRPDGHQRPVLNPAQERFMKLLDQLGGCRQWLDSVQA
jgi:hypothetical protein